MKTIKLLAEVVVLVLLYISFYTGKDAFMESSILFIICSWCPIIYGIRVGYTICKYKNNIQ